MTLFTRIISTRNGRFPAHTMQKHGRTPINTATTRSDHSSQMWAQTTPMINRK